MPNGGRRFLLVSAGVVLIGITVGEHFYRVEVQRHYEAAKIERQRIDRELIALSMRHEQAEDLLRLARAKNVDLTESLAEKHLVLEETIARLIEEERTIQYLERQVGSMEIKIGRLQGELALALERLPEDSGGGNSVQLERVVIGEGSQPSGTEGRVVSVDRDWKFVVIDLGWDAVNIGDTVSIFREEELLAKARVERVQEDVAAASILPDWKNAPIEVNDTVQAL